MRRFLEASFEQIEPAISESFVKNSLDKAKEFKGLKLIANIFLFIVFGSYAAFGASIYMGNHMDEAVGGLDVNNEFIPVFSSLWYIHIQILPILIGIGALVFYRNRNRFKGVYIHNIFVGIFMVFFLLLMFKIFQLFVTPFFLRMIYTVLYIFVFIYTIRIGYFNTKNLVFGEAKKRPFLVEWVSQHSKKILSVLFTIGVAYYGFKVVTPSAANMEQRLIGSLADFLPLAIILANFVNLYSISTSIRAYYVHKYSEQFREKFGYTHEEWYGPKHRREAA